MSEKIYKIKNPKGRDFRVRRIYTESKKWPSNINDYVLVQNIRDGHMFYARPNTMVEEGSN